jgi:ubiquinone/menaquinone biosynthesis C-methylase UbiE
MDHDERVRQEFTRQSDHFASAAKIADSQLTQRFVDAVAPQPGWRVLDVACGPGLVTVALAPHAREVVGLDLTPEMLNKARQRCAAAGVRNVRFEQGSASDLPFDANSFDAVVTRLSLHHFDDPVAPLAQMARVLRPGGRFVVADVVSSEDPEESALHNAIEILRDPSHVRMLPASELLALLSDAGLEVVERATWDMHREFEEWAQIVDDPARVAPVRTIARTLAKLGQHAGTGLSLADGKVVFFHRWLLVTARKVERRF